MNMLRSLSIACLLLVPTLAAQTTPVSSSTAASSKDECIVSGIVVMQGSNEPLKTARVQLKSAEDANVSTTVATDAGGTFLLNGVKPGHYFLRVARIGFVSQEYGQRTPTQPGAILTLTPGQNMHDLIFRLVPTAVISGRIQNEDGEALPWARVTAHRQVYANGKRRLTQEQIVSTNDRGEYRLFGLHPGRYLVSATYRTGTHPIGREQEFDDLQSDKGYMPTFYPGSPTFAKAEAISVKAGEEIPSIDFVLLPVAVYHIRGHVSYAIGTLATATRNPQITIRLMARDNGNGWVDHSMSRSEILSADGMFDLMSVLPGSYILTAESFDENQAHVASQNVDVGSTNVEGLQLTITAGIPISGHVHWDGSPSLQKDQEFRIMLHNPDNFYAFRGTILSDGSLSFKDVADGSYRVSVQGLSQDSYLKAVSYGGVDSLEDGVKVRHNPDVFLEITLSSRAARVQGAVSDPDGLPSPGVWVVLVPDASRRDKAWLYHSVQTDQHGQFTIRGVTPGDYKLFSWNEVEQDAWQDPDFLKQFEDKGLGEKVMVQEGDAKSVNLVTIKTTSTEEQKP